MVAVVLGTGPTALIREMPVWALETVERRALAEEVWRSVAGLWDPEPGFTLFTEGGAENPLQVLENVVPTILEHHPRAVCLDVIGVAASQELADVMGAMRFAETGLSEDGFIFKRPIDDIQQVSELVMDASGWKSWDDIYSSFFEVVGAPAWHGRNLSALDDSIMGGAINRIEVPYNLVISNLNLAAPEGEAAAQDFVEFLRRLKSHGCPVSVTIRK